MSSWETAVFWSGATCLFMSTPNCNLLQKLPTVAVNQPDGLEHGCGERRLILNAYVQASWKEGIQVRLWGSLEGKKSSSWRSQLLSCTDLKLARLFVQIKQKTVYDSLIVCVTDRGREYSQFLTPWIGGIFDMYVLSYIRDLLGSVLLILFFHIICTNYFSCIFNEGMLLFHFYLFISSSYSPCVLLLTKSKKVKFTLYQAIKSQRRSRSKALLVL